MGILGDAAAGAALGSGISPGLGTLLGGAAGAIGSLGSSLLGLKSQSDTNKAQMKLAEYEWQKNLEMWNLSNEFNSPLRQVERLRQAGLNPNLVYGGNSVGNSSSNAPNYNAPQLKAYTDFTGVGNAASTALNVAMAYRDLDMKDEQKRLLSNQADAMQVESLKKMQETANEFWKTARSKFDLELASDLRQTSIEAAQEGVNKIRKDIEESNSRMQKISSDIILNEAKWDLTLAQRDNLRAATAILKEDLDIKKFTNTMIKNGINPHSGIGERLLSALLGSVFGETYVKFMDSEVR